MGGWKVVWEYRGSQAFHYYWPIIISQDKQTGGCVAADSAPSGGKRRASQSQGIFKLILGQNKDNLLAMGNLY